MDKKRINLSDTTVRALVYRASDGRNEKWDKRLPGFGIRVNKNGSKTWLLNAKFPGEVTAQRHRLGDFKLLAENAARAKAHDWLRQLDDGIDPEAELERVKEEAAREAAGKTAFGIVARAYIEKRLPSKRHGDVDARDIVRNLIPAWEHKPITDIKRRDVVKLLDGLVERDLHVSAEHVLSHIRLIFKWAISRDGYGVEHNPARDVDKAAVGIKERVRGERVLDDAELRALWTVADDIGYPVGNVVKLLMLTGARLNEIASASWSELNDAGDLLTVPVDRVWSWSDPERRVNGRLRPGFKGGRKFEIPLVPEARRIIAKLPRWAVDGRNDSFVFASTRTKGAKPINSWSNDKDEIDARMSEILGHAPKPWTFHDIRRTVYTRLSGLGVLPHIVEQVTGHAVQGLARTYNHHDYRDEKRDALTKWAKELLRIVGAKAMKAAA